MPTLATPAPPFAARVARPWMQHYAYSRLPMRPWPERPRRFQGSHVAGVRGMPITLGGWARDAQRGSLPQLRAVDAKWGRSAGLPSAQKTAPNLRPTPLVRTPEPAARYDSCQEAEGPHRFGGGVLLRAEEAGLVFHHCRSC